MRCDQRHQLARPLGLVLESALAKAHLLHIANDSHPAVGVEVVQIYPRVRAPEMDKTGYQKIE